MLRRGAGVGLGRVKWSVILDMLLLFVDGVPLVDILFHVVSPTVTNKHPRAIFPAHPLHSVGQGRRLVCA